jgi:outer membrane protein assembly factor BamA
MPHQNQLFLIFLVYLLICGSCLAEVALTLDKLTITGLQTLDAEDLITGLKLQSRQLYTPETGNLLKEQLQKYLSQQGYYFSTVSQADIILTGKSGVQLVFNVEEGYSGKLHELRFTGNRYFSEDKIRQLLVLPGQDRLLLTDLPSIMNKTLNLYASRGYLFAQVSIDTLKTTENKLTAVIMIDEGPLFKGEKYVFSGNKVTRPATLLRISGLTQVRQLTPESLTQAEDKVLLKSYIKACRIAPLDGSTLSIAVEEGRMTKIEGVLGLTTNPDTEARNLSGYINLQFLNLWGTDRSIALNWQSPKSANRLLRLAYHESGFGPYPLAGDFQFQRVQQEAEWITVKADLSIYYTHLLHKFGADLYNENLYPDSQGADAVKKSTYYSVAAIWEYNGADYLPNPTRGNKFKLKGGWLFKQAEEDNKSLPLTEIDATFWLPINPRVIYSLAPHYREISDQVATEHEQYKLGGFNSLRGYIEDSFSGWRIGWLNNEIGYLMTRDSRIFMLFDYGVHQTGGQNISQGLMGTGIGLSVQTKLGIISISYALAIAEGHLARVNSGILHMGLASTF